MIQDYAKDIAAQMGIQLSRVSIFAGHKVGCIDVHLLNLSSNGKTVSAMVNQSDLDNLQNGTDYDHLEMKVRAALCRLKLMLAP
jgi:hypothetical protein